MIYSEGLRVKNSNNYTLSPASYSPESRSGSTSPIVLAGSSQPPSEHPSPSHQLVDLNMNNLKTLSDGAFKGQKPFNSPDQNSLAEHTKRNNEMMQMGSNEVKDMKRPEMKQAGPGQPESVVPSPVRRISSNSKNNGVTDSDSKFLLNKEPSINLTKVNATLTPKEETNVAHVAGGEDETLVRVTLDGIFRKVKSACVSCRKSRVKCDKMLPCSRCRRLGLECKPQLRGRGRPPSTFKSPASDVSTSESVMGSPVPSVGRKRSRPSNASDGSLNKQIQMGVNQFGRSGSSRESIPEPVLAFNEYDIMIKAFNNFLLQGKVQRNVAIGVTRMWAHISRRTKDNSLKDKSDKIAKLLCTNLSDIFSGNYNDIDPLLAFEKIPAKYKFREQWDNQDGAYMQQTIVNGMSTFICNDLFDTLFFNASDLKSGRRKLSDIFFEEDRDEFYESLSEALYTSKNEGGSMIRHTLRLNVSSSNHMILGLIYYHSYISLDGSICHNCVRVLPLPLSRHYSHIKDTMFHHNMFSLEQNEKKEVDTQVVNNQSKGQASPISSVASHQQQQGEKQQQQQQQILYGMPFPFQPMMQLNNATPIVIQANLPQQQSQVKDSSGSATSQLVNLHRNFQQQNLQQNQNILNTLNSGSNGIFGSRASIMPGTPPTPPQARSKGQAQGNPLQQSQDLEASRQQLMDQNKIRMA